MTKQQESIQSIFEVNVLRRPISRRVGAFSELEGTGGGY